MFQEVIQPYQEPATYTNPSEYQRQFLDPGSVKDLGHINCYSNNRFTCRALITFMNEMKASHE
ncbi:hypothetical protein Pmar_PMAR021975 [Perkinsus marinus ATCC 50983]|uniref:Uncharacterized protein n=1 Tax=Perkinsus marinus (strain ATCC 50983 / TXsc) TaxID=423536 RepID=C5LRP2_PERM5|nr:hypothetical protein Pmar_PMAR021972 [Perkinsus marinus ATCC 50983]XP_002767886.1 hypothetical protein Pmar_PMAR021975 [Perkinsus marinus ATCC 50983]EER00601.1 hypothetical protein Pmar_PMAR021972 [Perkinsus marinus ATCC 50983]EER00604.1 hypothetical protein Pmar_PMAR021975 [Perkinsus marinus ATCC 50983]|eukprot:XP_002767883.1 hypothetical protein Pmar_PMAR021972 [Perkinsus marinus ATCC 50983]